MIGVRFIQQSEFYKMYNLSNITYNLCVNNSMLLDDELIILKTLWDYVKAEYALEIGIRKGFTAQFLMNNSPWLSKYIGIDVPCSYITPLEQQRHEVTATKALYINDYAKLDLRILPNGSYDVKCEDLPELGFVFIDGDHSQKGLLNDSILALSKINNSGVVCWHDFNNVKDVNEVLTFLSCKFNLEIFNIVGTYLCFCFSNI